MRRAAHFCTNRRPIAIPITGRVNRLAANFSDQHPRGVLMNSFTLTAVGNLARNPELVAKNDSSYARFCLVGNDYAGKDEEGAAREVVTSLWFVAFGAMGEALARNARKGDQLFIEARVRASNWTDKQGEKQYDHSFIMDAAGTCCIPRYSCRDSSTACRSRGPAIARNCGTPRSVPKSATTRASHASIRSACPRS